MVFSVNGRQYNHCAGKTNTRSTMLCRAKVLCNECTYTHYPVQSIQCTVITLSIVEQFVCLACQPSRQQELPITPIILPVTWYQCDTERLKICDQYLSLLILTKNAISMIICKYYVCTTYYNEYMSLCLNKRYLATEASFC